MVFALMGYIIAEQEHDRASGMWVVTLLPDILSVVFGESEADIQKAIDFLCSKDPASRSKEADGRRLIRLRESSFEYQVVNGAKYQDMRDYEERKVQNREAQQRYRDKHAGDKTKAQVQAENDDRENRFVKSETEEERDRIAAEGLPGEPERHRPATKLDDPGEILAPAGVAVDSASPVEHEGVYLLVDHSGAVPEKYRESLPGVSPGADLVAEPSGELPAAPVAPAPEEVAGGLV